MTFVASVPAGNSGRVQRKARYSPNGTGCFSMTPEVFLTSFMSGTGEKILPSRLACSAAGLELSATRASPAGMGTVAATLNTADLLRLLGRERDPELARLGSEMPIHLFTVGCPLPYASRSSSTAMSSALLVW